MACDAGVNGNTYSIATFKKEFDFTGESLARIKAYAKSFKAQINALNQQRAADAVLRGDEAYSVNGGACGGNELTGPSGCINWDKDELPL